MIIQGTAYYCRISGKPYKSEYSLHPEWTFELSISPEEKQKLLEAGMRKNFVKNKGGERGDYLSFKRSSVKSDGSPGKPFDVIDAQGKPWDGRLIGNGSVLNVSVKLNEREDKKLKQMYLAPGVLGIQVWDLVEYHRKSDFPVKEATENLPTEATEEGNW